ncbi:MAG TPA: uroporphyrinogen-III synthase, partial [Gammaproteobacteria bacterium]|nr:uroporphyrinogen-III synthase [Gammaproteobacteria bacterium]
MTSIKTHELNNIGILVTRPAHQAEPLCRLISQHGGNPIRFPVLEIIDIGDNPHFSNQIQRLNEFDIAIFISPNAAEKAITRIKSVSKWPNHIKIAAVGKSSAKALD